jgi:predicted Zn finger-like uncharacterized protein
VKIRCPKCATRYAVDPDALLAADGMARCFRCGATFDAVADHPAAARDGRSALRLDAQAEVAAAPDEPRELPFDLPPDLEPLQPSVDGALDVADTLYEKKSSRGFWYGLVATLLIVALGLQLAWQHRGELLQRYPQLAPVCRYVSCRPEVIRAPERFRVLQRDIAPASNEPGSLTLTARIRNDADIAQHLPDIQLSLLDNNGRVLIRRRLSPQEYMYPPPSNERVVAAGEVLTIELDFEDPGYLATGFVIDFL